MFSKVFLVCYFLLLSFQCFAENEEHLTNSGAVENDDNHRQIDKMMNSSENLEVKSLMMVVESKKVEHFELLDHVEVNLNLDNIPVENELGDKYDLMKKIWAEYGTFKKNIKYKKGKGEEVVYLLPNSRSQINIPLSIYNSRMLKLLESLSLSELNRFIEKKQSFLSRFAHLLQQFNVKPLTINQALIELNEQFYQSHRLLGKSNSLGGTVMFSISGGLALPQKVVRALKNKFQFADKYLPESGGFYYLLGLGAGIVKTRDLVTSKEKISFELFVDSERLIKTMTGMVEVSMAGTYGVIYELRDGSFQRQSNQTFYGGATGVFRRGETQFGWAASTGLSIPPGIGAFLIYQDQTTRHYLLRGSVDSKVIMPLIQFIGHGYRLTKSILRPQGLVEL